MTDLNNLKSLFLINPEITYLNTGSYGACPKPIFDDYQKWQRELEFEAVQFISVNGPKYLEQSRNALANFIHCNGDDVVYVPNPTYASNIIVKSLKLNPGDEVLTTDLEYGAIDKTWEYYCKKSNAKVIRQKIELPIVSKETFIEQFFRGLSNKTVAVFLSHITSTTALMFPVKEICEIAKEKGLLTCIDGAHAPGHLPIDLSQLKADIYTGACHKWMMTPKGSSFLYVKRELQPLFDPLVISWGYESANPSHSKFLDYHQLQGTRDISAFLTIPKAIEFMKEHNWHQVAAECRALIKKNAVKFCDLLGSSVLAPLTDNFIGQMISFPLKTSQPEKIYRQLFDTYKIEVPIMKHGERIFIRISVQGFNNQHDFDKLYAALEEIIKTTDLINT